MRRVLIAALTVSALFGGILSSRTLKRVAAAGEDQAILQADHDLIKSVATGDKSAVAELLDADFTWTDSDGSTKTRADVLKSLPKPALGDETGADVHQRNYGELAAIMADRGKVDVLRIWVHRPAGWRVFVYHEVHLSDQPSAAAGSGVKDCENPCKSLPFRPKNDAERAIITSWQSLETGVTSHDAAAWASHVADEFVMVSSSNSHPFTKADRMATLNLQKQTGVGSAPSPLVSAQMFDFGDAVVMNCLHQPRTGKPVRVSRVWIKRDGQWVMSISYQTTILAAPAKTS
jgi:hypothetical protein